MEIFWNWRERNGSIFACGLYPLLAIQRFNERNLSLSIKEHAFRRTLNNDMGDLRLYPLRVLCRNEELVEISMNTPRIKSRKKIIN